MPGSPSGMQWPASQWADGSQSPSPAQLEAHSGVDWSAAPVQYTDGYTPQSFASISEPHAESSATGADGAHIASTHSAS